MPNPRNLNAVSNHSDQCQDSKGFLANLLFPNAPLSLVLQLLNPEKGGQLC